jgi:colanic acid/amylovoran biosynthesis glycosyltransferase
MSEQISSASTFYRDAVRPIDGAQIASAASCAPKTMPAAHKIAYLVSEYPKVSHSFIRREIVALEKRGWSITRFSIRDWSKDLVDPADIRESLLTTSVLGNGAVSLVLATSKVFIRRPLRFVEALCLALRMAIGSDKPFVWHLIYLAEACWIAQRLEKQGITHLHAHFGTNPTEVAMLVGVLSKIGYSFTVHGPEEFDRARHIHLKEKVARSRMVVAISSFGRSQLFRAVDHGQWAKIKIVHCGIDQAFSDIAVVSPSLARRVVCVGRLCEQKGQLLLVEAVAMLRDQGITFELILVGDGEHRNAIEGRIREYRLDNQVRITGWASAEKVKEEMLLARALIMPSFAEGLPVVLMEAMALGRPVLSTYVAGIPELVVDGKSGWLFPAGSIEHMAASIRACLDAGESELTSMGEYARARALDRHDVDKEVLKLERLFQSAMGG